jgi:hypothetical protein
LRRRTALPRTATTRNRINIVAAQLRAVIAHGSIPTERKAAVVARLVELLDRLYDAHECRSGSCRTANLNVGVLPGRLVRVGPGVVASQRAYITVRRAPTFPGSTSLLSRPRFPS